MNKPKGIYLLKDKFFPRIYGPQEQALIRELVDIGPGPLPLEESSDAPLSDVEIIFSGWGAPVFGQALLDRMPRLKAIFYGAGSVRRIMTDGIWERGITVTSAYYANAIPVAEFTFAQIILALKRTWQYALKLRAERRWSQDLAIPGCFHGTKVGIIALGTIGRLVCERLRSLDVEVLAYDPYASPSQMETLGVCGASLEELFAECEVISLHAPKLDSTLNMIQDVHFRLMPAGATFINTSRGAIVDEVAMLHVLQERPDILAVLDVTTLEPPEPGSALFTLPNVILTPHIAGSMGRECRRMGHLAMTECQRFLRGEPPLYPVNVENFHLMA